MIEDETDGSGDGAARVSPAVLRAVADADAYFGYGIPAELLESGPRLQWVHSGAAGVGSSLTPTMMESPVVFTNSAGVHAPPMAETVLAMILFFGRGLDFAVQNQAEAKWAKESFYTAGAPLGELSSSTVGIVGFGGIGREVARRVAALGARVMAVKRTPPRQGEADLAPVAGTGGLGSRIEILAGSDGLDVMLRESDVVVLAAPETSQTRGLMDARAISLMKKDAILINVARGKLVDEDALVAALRSGRIRGAGLDVFSREPLAPDHALWSLENVVLTPHVSAVTRGFWRRETDLMVRNLGRFLTDAPPADWENVVDKGAGY